jgi:Mg2+ and Co2+ transporter CorA
MANEKIQPLLDWPTFTGFLILAIVLIGAALVWHNTKGK